MQLPVRIASPVDQYHFNVLTSVCSRAEVRDKVSNRGVCTRLCSVIRHEPIVLYGPKGKC